MSAQVQQPQVAALPGASGRAVPALDRAQARLQAHRLTQQVQIRDTGDAIARQLAVAEERGWSEVVRILLYADLVRAWVGQDDDREATIERLYERAVRDSDDVLLASALASRAEFGHATGSATEHEQASRDLARAAALLEVAAGGALERATAAIDVGISYVQREMWELAQQMFASAAAVLPDCEEPLLVPALRHNWVFLDANYACNLREIGETAELRRLGERAAAAGRLDQRTAGADTPFGVEARVYAHLLARLVGAAPVDQPAELRRALGGLVGPFDEPTHGLLHLAEAVYAAERGDWADAAEHADRAHQLMPDDHMGPPITALTLRLVAEAQVDHGSPGAAAALAYCDWSARCRWNARLQLLAAARASLEAEQLRVDRDEQARQAQVDELTGLANRRAYTLHTERRQVQAAEAPLAALVVDVDGFKQVNDTFGHDVGDAVLVRVAGMLSGATRAGDLVARLGGDEFVVLLDGLGEEAARRRATDILRGLAAADWSALADGLAVRISIGIAVGTAGDAQRILVSADKALYRQKGRGGHGLSLAAPGQEAPPARS